MNFPFSKYEGAGNDFILLEDLASKFSSYDEKEIAIACHRQKGIGADGLILLQRSTHADFLMRVFNADGSEAAMCGNGLRCLLAFIRTLGFPEKNYQIETGAGVFSACYKSEGICISHPKPAITPLTLKLQEKMLDAHFVDTGVPHLVIFSEILETIAVDEEGRNLRFHPEFGKEGVNVNFAQRESSGQVRMRTYERGVERETLSCSTGAAAVAYISSLIYGMNDTIKILPKSLETIEVFVGEVLDVIGPVNHIFDGIFKFNKCGN